ncbi:hypothetical protein ACX12L_06515 [Alicycliphilus sp. T452]
MASIINRSRYTVTVPSWSSPAGTKRPAGFSGSQAKTVSSRVMAAIRS